MVDVSCSALSPSVVRNVSDGERAEQICFKKERTIHFFVIIILLKHFLFKKSIFYIFYLLK